MKLKGAKLATYHAARLDGTDRTFNVSAPFTRRMWVGVNMKWCSDVALRVDDEVEEKTTMLGAVAKKSRSVGEMVLVEVEKEFWGPEGLVLTDRRSWVFRPEIDPDAVVKPPQALRDIVKGPSSVRDLEGKEPGKSIVLDTKLGANRK